MPRKKQKAQRGRPRLELDWEILDKLCGIQATKKEIASWFDCDEDTINNHCKREKKCLFSVYYKQKAEKGKISLRRAQVQKALTGNPAMLIWLGKQYLGQTDKMQDVTEIDDYVFEDEFEKKD